MSYLKATTAHKEQLTALNADGEVGRCILKTEVSSMMNKISLAKGVHPFSIGNWRVNSSSVSFHVSYSGKNRAVS